MGVFNAAANQVLIKPVTEYYRGKAIRQDQADKEQMSELRGLQIEGAKQELAEGPVDRAAAKKYAESKQDLIDEQLSQLVRAGKIEDLRFSANQFDPLLRAYSATEDEDVAIGNFNNSFKAIAGNFSQEHQERFREIAGEDGLPGFSNKEIMMVGKMIASFRERFEPGKRSPLNPKDFTPESWASYAASGYADDALLRAVPKAPLVTIDQKGETAATQAYGGTVGERAGERDDKALATYAEDASLTRLELALARGARTGFGEDIILDVRGALDTLGMLEFPEGAEESEVTRSIGHVLALRMRNPDSGLGLTGNTSNKDLAFLKASVAGIGRSEGGNILLVKMARRLNQFKRDIAQEQARIISEGDGGVPINLDARLMTFANGYDMFTASERKEIRDGVKSDNVSGAIGDASDEAVLKALGLD